MRFSARFIDPSAYGAYRFSRLPATIFSALSGVRSQAALPDDVFPHGHRKYEKVVFFLIDSFGWDYFNRACDRSPFLSSLCQRGKATRLAAQFPSTTACEITTANTGLDVGQHGIYEWYYYEPKAGDMIAPLLYSYAREHRQRETLQKDKTLLPSSIYPSETMYKKLREIGIGSYVFQNSDYARSTYSTAMFDGAKVNGFGTLAEGLFNLSEAILNEKGPAYFYFYFDKIDAVSHQYGPSSGQLQAEIDVFVLSLEHILWDRIKERAKNVLFLMTADHGQTTIDPGTCIYLNRAIPELLPYLRRTPDHGLMVPAGSCRDMFLYIKAGHIDEVRALLQDRLDGKAIVCKTSDLLDQGYFMRRDISKALAERLGDLVILPLPGESVWWFEKDVYEIHFLGHHGGLTREEMEIPLLAWDL